MLPSMTKPRISPVACAWSVVALTAVAASKTRKCLTHLLMVDLHDVDGKRPAAIALDDVTS
jgi:hypothetical protein